MNKMKWVLRVAAVLVVGIGVVFFVKKKPSSSIRYEKTQVTKGDLQSKILSTGVVQPENRLDIKPPDSGRIEEVRVDEGRVVKKGDVLAIMSSSERAALLDAARAKGAEELKKWSEFYQAAPIFAPINGTIILRNVEPGQTVTNQDALFTMSDRLTVKAQVDETDISEIKLKQKALIVLDAYPNSQVQAHVDQIAFDAKTVNNVTTYVVDVLPDQTPPFMRSGMTANVTFYSMSKLKVLRIPNSAISGENNHYFVLSAPQKPGDSPLKKEITIGLSDGKFTEVLSGLTEGDSISIPQFNSEVKGSQNSNNPFSPYSNRRR